MLVFQMVVKGLLGWHRSTTYWAEAFMSLALMGSSHMLVHPVLRLICFETFFKRAVLFSFGQSTCILMFVFSLDWTEHFATVFTFQECLSITKGNKFLLVLVLFLNVWHYGVLCHNQGLGSNGCKNPSVGFWNASSRPYYLNFYPH